MRKAIDNFVLDDGRKGAVELWLHYLWKLQKLTGVKAVSLDNRPLKVIFPGWYNRGWGPDFKDARIIAGEETFFGDVEIHLEESDWTRHKHHEDERYNKVILHVFLVKSRRRARTKLDGVPPSLCLEEINPGPIAELPRTREDIKEMPGACGLLLTPDKYQKIKSLVFQASEQRLLDKSAPFLETLNQNQEDPENILFSSICKYLGYSNRAEEFFEMSRVYPYSGIVKFFRALHRESRVEILGRWLGFANILDSINLETMLPESRREWLLFRELWRKTGDKPFKPSGAPRRPSRPLNSPLRRLSGLYYHLEKVQFQGLIKSWLKFFLDCRETLDKGKLSLKKLTGLLGSMFPQPEWETLNNFLSADSAKKLPSKTALIGPKRQLIILVNSVLPFFLAWSRFYRDEELEKTLFALFLLLPGEGENHKTRFMERRLFHGRQDFKVKKNLSWRQGLIQLHDDCCRSFYEGCDNCSLMRMMKA